MANEPSKVNILSKISIGVRACALVREDKKIFVTLQIVEKYTRIPALTRKQFLDTMMVLITAELADSLCGVIDGIVVGRFLGPDALAAHGVATPVFTVLCIFSYMVTVGFQQPCTMAIGKGQMREANGLYSFTLLITLGMGLLSLALGLLFPEGTARMLGAGTGSTCDMASQYIRAVSIGYPAILLFLILIPVLQIDGQWELVHIGSILMAVSDVVLDVLNVKVFHLGMWGIGMATCASYYLGLLVLLLYYFRKNRIFRFRFKDLRSMRPYTMLRFGLPAGIRVGARALSYILLSALTLSLAGTSAMTALSVQRNISYVFLSVGIGISGAVLLLSGISYGEQDRRGLMDIIRMSAHTCLILGGGLGLLVFLSAPLLVTLFLGEATPLPVYALRGLAMALPLMAWNRCTGAYLQGIGKNRQAVVLYLCAELLFLVGVPWLMGSIWGAKGIFAGFPLSQLLLLLLVNLLVWMRRDRRYQGAEAFLCIPKDIGVPPENRLVRTLTRQEEVWALAEEAQTFCLEHGTEADKAYWVSMYIEEMGNIIMIYGFADGKPHKLEVRLALSPDRIVLRFRDDCRRFDIREKARHWEEDPAHPETTLGIRMVMQGCKDLKYNNSLNTNNLLVVL